MLFLSQPNNSNQLSQLHHPVSQTPRSSFVDKSAAATSPFFKSMNGTTLFATQSLANAMVISQQQQQQAAATSTTNSPFNVSTASTTWTF